MFLNDRINPRSGNLRRKKALMRAAAKAQSQVGGHGNRAGGGLGRGRFQSRLSAVAGGRSPFGQFPQIDNIDDPFLQSETQPGEYDQGASDAAGGDLSSLLDPNSGPGIEILGGGGDPTFQGDGLVGQQQGQAPPGYVWFQGQLIPSGVYRAMQAQGGF